MKLNQPRNKILVLILIIGLFALPSLAGVTTIGDTITAVSNIISNGAPHIDVRAYGAVGDGVTDDTTAINRALSGSRSKTVSCAGGVFNVTTLNIPAHTSFVGNGNCTLRWYTTVAVQTAMIQNTNQVSGLGVDTDITISGITFDDFGWNPGNTRAIYFKNVTHATIKNNVFKNFTHGIAAITPNAFLLIDGNDFSDFGVGGNGDAITLTGGTYLSQVIGNSLNTTHGDTTVDGVVIDENSTGIPAISGHDNIVIGNTINGTGHGIVIEGSHNNTIADNVIIGVAVSGISLTEGQATTAPRDNKLHGNIIRALPAADGIRIIGYSNTANDNDIMGGNIGIRMNDINALNSPNRYADIKDNTISFTASDGINVDECLGCSVVDNTVVNSSTNGIKAVSTNGAVTSLKISGNTVSNASLIGIYIQSDTSDINLVKISNNIVLNSGWGNPNTFEAIYTGKGAGALTNLTINSNTITSISSPSPESGGVRIDAGAIGVFYSDNYIFSLSNRPLYTNGYTVASPPTFVAPRGSIVWNAQPASGATPGWVNVDGTNAGWKAMGNLA